MWEIESDFLQNFLKPVQVVLITKEGRFGVGPGGVFGDLLEAGVGGALLLSPCVKGGKRHSVRDGQFVFPHDPVLLGDVLAGEVRGGLFARLAVEEVAEVVGGVWLGEVALAHLNYYKGTLWTYLSVFKYGKGWGEDGGDD